LKASESVYAESAVGRRSSARGNAAANPDVRAIFMAQRNRKLL